MGGIGSGRHTRYGTRKTVEDMNPLRIVRLARDGWLRPGLNYTYSWTISERPAGDIRVTSAVGHVVLNYRSREHGGEWRDYSYPVKIDRTPCHFGGTRSWFLCPVPGCGRRVAILYGGSVFACRHCQGLAYPSENEGAHDRAARRVEKLRARLQWPPGMFEGSRLGKPKHMHNVTYEKLVTEYDQREAVALGAVLQWLDRFN